MSQAHHIAHTLWIAEHLHDEMLGKPAQWSYGLSSISRGYPKLSCQYTEVTMRVPSPQIQKECLLTLLKAKGFSYSADREESERKKEDNRLPEAQFMHPQINESFQLNYLP